jgi:hypothetical protein
MVDSTSTFPNGGNNPIQNVNINTWYHMVYVNSGSTWYVYVNGALVQTFTGRGSTYTQQKIYNTIGKGITSQPLKVNGRVDGFFIYNSTLSLAQIQDIYSKGQNPSPTNYYYTVPINYNYGNSIYSTTLTSGTYYPIQISWSQSLGGSVLGFQYQPPSGSYTSNGSGFFFYGSGSGVNTSWNSGIISSAFANNGSTLTYTQNPYNGSGVYVGGGSNNVFWKTVVNEVGTICGEYIQIQFPQPIKVATYSLKFS